MSEQNSVAAAAETPAQRTRRLVERGLKRRYRSEYLFRSYGIAAIAVGLLFIGLLFTSILSAGLSIFTQTYVKLDIEYSAEELGLSEKPTAEEIDLADYQALVRAAMRERFPEVEGGPTCARCTGSSAAARSSSCASA